MFVANVISAAFGPISMWIFSQQTTKAKELNDPVVTQSMPVNDQFNAYPTQHFEEYPFSLLFWYSARLLYSTTAL